MSEKAGVIQGSQRNLLDVATELTIFTAKYNAITDSEEIKQLYAEFYSLAKALDSRHRNYYDGFIPEEILSKMPK